MNMHHTFLCLQRSTSQSTASVPTSAAAGTTSSTETTVRAKTFSSSSTGALDKDRVLLGADGGPLSEVRGLLEKERGLLEKEQGLLDKERGLLDKEQGLLNKQRGLLDMDRGLLNKGRGVLDKDVGVLEKGPGVLGRPTSSVSFADKDVERRVAEGRKEPPRPKSPYPRGRPDTPPPPPPPPPDLVPRPSTPVEVTKRLTAPAPAATACRRRSCSACRRAEDCGQCKDLGKDAASRSSSRDRSSRDLSSTKQGHKQNTKAQTLAGAISPTRTYQLVFTASLNITLIISVKKNISSLVFGLVLPERCWVLGFSVHLCGGKNTVFKPDPFA